MQAIRNSIPPTVFETFPRAVTKASARQFRLTATMSNSLTYEQFKIENKALPSAPGVNLTESQQVITGSILDLFAGRPSKRKLTLWNDNATFSDPLTIAEGRKQYEPQWYGLAAVFSNIERLGGQVTSSGNPIEMDMKTRYTVKGLGSQQTIDSKIKIWTEGEGANIKITRVEDRWDDKLPDSTFKNALRNLNSKTVPLMVSRYQP